MNRKKGWCASTDINNTHADAIAESNVFLFDNFIVLLFSFWSNLFKWNLIENNELNHFLHLSNAY